MQANVKTPTEMVARDPWVVKVILMWVRRAVAILEVTTLPVNTVTEQATDDAPYGGKLHLHGA